MYLAFTTVLGIAAISLRARAGNVASPVRVQTFSLGGDQAYQCACPEPDGIPFFGQCTPDLLAQPNHPCHSMLSNCHSCTERVQLHRRGKNRVCPFIVPSTSFQRQQQQQLQETSEALVGAGALAEPNDQSFILEKYGNMNPSIATFRVLRVADSTPEPVLLDMPSELRVEYDKRESELGSLGIDLFLTKEVFMAERGYLLPRIAISAMSKISSGGAYERPMDVLADYRAYMEGRKDLEKEMAATLATIGGLRQLPVSVAQDSTARIAPFWLPSRWVRFNATSTTEEEPISSEEHTEYVDTVLATRVFNRTKPLNNKVKEGENGEETTSESAAIRLRSLSKQVLSAATLVEKVLKEKKTDLPGKVSTEMDDVVENLHLSLSSGKKQLSAVAFRWTQLLSRAQETSDEHLEPLRTKLEIVRESLATAVHDVRDKMSEWKKRSEEHKDSPTELDDFDEYLATEFLSAEFILE